MKFLSHSRSGFATPAAASIVLVGLVLAQLAGSFDWFASFRWDEDSLTDLVRQNKFDSLNESAWQKIAAKEHLVAGLLDGETTLMGSTEIYLLLIHGNEPHWAAIRGLCPGRTDKETAARHLIFCATNRGEKHPRFPEVHDQLLCELEELIALETARDQVSRPN